MRTYGQNFKVEDKDDFTVQSQLVLANLKKGEKFKINGVEYVVTAQTAKTLRLKKDPLMYHSRTTKIYSFKVEFFEKYGVWSCNTGKGVDPADNLLRDIEGDLSVDKLNSYNPFHKVSDCGQILLRDPVFEETKLGHYWNNTKDIYNNVIDSNFMGQVKNIFSLPHVKSEVKRYANGFKGEGKQSKQAFLILERYMKREDVTDEEKKFFKDQMIDLLKGVGVVLPIQLIPLPFISTILLIVMEKTMLSMGIKILPSSFYEKEEDEKRIENI